MQEEKSQIVEKYEEIDLRQVIKTLLKRKKMIFGLAILVGILVIAIGFILPLTYRITAAIEIGTMANQCSDVGAATIEMPVQVKDKINKDIYGAQVRKDLGLGAMPAISALNTVGTNALYLSMASNDPEKAKNYLSQVCQEILEIHKKISDDQKVFFTNRIAQIKEEIAKLKVDVNLWQGANCNNFQIPQLEYQVSCSQLSLASIKYSDIISPPISAEPARSRILAMGFLGVVVGFFMGIFIALAADWWRKP